VDQAVQAEIEGGLASGDEDRRWKAAIRLGEYVQSAPEAVWELTARWGCSDDADTRTALATCVLEHLLEYHFEDVFPRTDALARTDSRFANTFLSCWKFGQSEERTNAARFEALKIELLARGAA